MATAHIRLGTVMNGGVPAYDPIPLALQAITTSASSQASTIAAPVGTGQSRAYFRLAANGGNICFAVGITPVATAASGDVVLSGTYIDLGPLTPGHKIAVIDA